MGFPVFNAQRSAIDNNFPVLHRFLFSLDSRNNFISVSERMSYNMEYSQVLSTKINAAKQAKE